MKFFGSFVRRAWLLLTCDERIIDIISCKTETFCASHIHNLDDDDDNNNWNRFYSFVRK